MAITDEQKIGLLDSVLAQVDNDLARQQLELDALNAELGVVSDAEKEAIQQNIDNTSQQIVKLTARQGVWQTQRDALSS